MSRLTDDPEDPRLTRGGAGNQYDNRTKDETCQHPPHWFFHHSIPGSPTICQY